MLRHVISLARSFAQIPNGIIRCPRLSSDAKNLLLWQLSLPPGNRECLSETARKAGIRKTAFQRAKRVLLAEGYLHEWRVQVEQGRFATVQLVSNTVLTAEEAAAVRDGRTAVPDAVRLVRPGAGNPAVGEPTGRAVGGPPEKKTGEEDHPPTPCEGEELLRSLGREQPRLAMPARTARRWAPLVAPWLESGLSPLRIRQALTQGLADVRSPLGVLKWRLEHALPDVPPHDRLAEAPAAAPPQPRVAGMRECAGVHTQPRLFRPAAGETLCAECRAKAEAEREPAPVGAGFARFLAARQARCV
ncbi:hypothetical protein E4198_15970 [Streptomyces sp. RKND-216]|uniref:hypothetical protein n=1 Tax=Streptomyces sp. RKND-216 TaxID=2562581 RepID=UPI00109D8726|nr:hypothetical protein [Streptomyces sp. RKND-216]THA25995.1 hypothetical protein E4198_15970 [Streptomyces sp. RKND-216]